MKLPNPDKRRHIGKILLAYGGSAWVIIQVITLIINQYDLPVALLDVSIITFFFGIPVAFLFALYGTKLTTKLRLIYTVILLLNMATIGFYFIRPNSMQPNQIRFLKFKNNQKELAESIQSVAVLPFSNYTGDDKKEFLSYAIHDALISEIGTVSSFRVISKTSTLSFKESKKSLQEIAKELKVDAIIEGSLLGSGDLIKINIKLINAFPEEVQLWTKNYSSSMTDLPNIFSIITRELAKEVNIGLTPYEKSSLAQKKSVDPAAYESYLKGKYTMGLLTMEGISAAKKHFEKAIEIDPEFAPAYAALGGIWGFLKQMNFVSTDEANLHFGPNIEKAEELDSTLAEIYYWKAVKYVWTDYSWDKGEKAFRKAISLNPNSSETRGLYSNYLMDMSRLEEAREQMDIALELDPLNPFIQVLNCVQYTFEGKPESGIALAASLQKNMPSNPLINLVLFMAYAEVGEFDLCIEQAKIWLELENHSELVPLLEREYTANGFKKAFLVTSNALEKKDNSKLAAQTMQNFYALSGNVDKTLDWMEKGYIRRDPDIPAINAVPILEPYRDHPRYKELAQRLGF